MADVSLKEQKLAAARKKLRKYQKRKGNGTDKSSKSGETSPYLEVLKSEISSSRSSSVTDISETGCNDLDLSEQNAKAVSLGNSVNNALNDSNITSSFEVPYDPSSISNASIIESAQTGPVDSFNSLSHQIGDKRPTDKYSHSGILYEENTKTGSETLSNPLNKIDSLENDGSVCSETNASITTVVHVKKDSNMLQNAQDIPIRSTTESLRQLSLQMSGLVNEAEMHDPNQQERTILELEKRNNELASLFETEKQKSAQQTCIIEEMGRTIESQNAQLQGFQKMPVADSNGMEVNGLREQLQVHIQTIGILVSEKSELQSSVSHHRYALEQKNGEVTELQGRLDASREHIKNLEGSLHELKAQLSTVSGSKENDSQQLIHLQENYSKLSKLCDEMRASTAELTERLAVRTEENQKLSAELGDVRRHYELAQVHLEQLRDNSTEDTRKRYEELEKSFSESQHQIQLSLTALEQVQSEKKQLELEYKMYTSQLMSETEELKQKLTKECEKCEALEASNAKLSQEVIAKEAGSKALHTLAAVKAERDQLTNSLSQVTEANSQLEEKCTSLTRDNGHLSQLLVEQSKKLEALEAAADRTSTQEVDTSQLLQSMQSDKVAAARALSQNKQLKEQLEELQNGFIMMSNKKLELTEKLEKELHLKKNLYKEISQLGEELSSHKQDILAKQREIEVLKGGRPLPQSPSGHMNGHGHQHGDHNHQHVDHDHHHGDHDHHHGDHDHHHGDHDHHHGDHDNHHNHAHHHEDGKPVQKTDSIVNSGSEEISNAKIEASVEMGIEPVCVEDSKERQSHTPNVCQHDHHNQDHVSLRVAYDALEKRFLKCMKDLAAVSNEKQDLEHVVEQLQLETETIGDYITIYQFQRGVMKQQMQDLNCEMDLMRTEKQAITAKLVKLQKLVESLVTNKSEIKAGFIEGLHSIINDTVKDPEKTEVEPDAEKGSAPLKNGSSVVMETSPPAEETSVKKTNTVKQIIDLISEMETSSQLDLSSLHKFHPCPHCSGKLITI